MQIVALRLTVFILAYFLYFYFSICRYKGEGIVNGSPQKVWECLKPDPNGLRLKWDNNVKKFELLEQVSTVGFVPAIDFTLMSSSV